MFFSKLFNQSPPEIGIVRGHCGNVVLPKTPPLCSDPPGTFSMYINDDAVALIEAEGKVTREEVLSLPHLVYNTIKALGLLRPDPVHFILNVRESRSSTESCMTIGKIVPPIQAANGDAVSRSLLIFAPPFRFDMNKAESDFATAKDQFSHLDPQTLQKFKSGFIQTRRMNCVTSLCHELVHLFATDEYRDRFKGWSLERIELLTDSITVEAVYPMVERSKDDFVKIGFIHGAAYLSNQLRKTMGDGHLDALVAAMKARSGEIIRKERECIGEQHGK